MSKKLFPRSLFARALLILVLPTLLIQLVTVYIFFDRHWDNVSKHMSATLAGEIYFLVSQLKDTPNKQKPKVVDEFEQATGVKISLNAEDFCQSSRKKHIIRSFPEFQDALREKIGSNFTLKEIENGSFHTCISLPDRFIKITASTKRLESPTTKIFIAWMLGATILFLLIAVFFLRNQIRPITRLASAADSFGRGIDTPGFRPHGATEVRKAARAFIVMRERIRKQLRTRTDMLANISHDLRTPLTRMKLQLAMLPADITAREDMREAIEELNDDVQQMQHMIAEYLDFARDEGREESVRINLDEFLEDVVSDYTRMQQPITVSIEDRFELELRLSPCRRMLHNLIDNALRYGKNCHVTLRSSGSYGEILIDDEGAGIPADKRDEVFKPFNRLEKSRNQKTGGVGLGLTIARDIVLAHGGTITLDSSPSGGLRVIVRMPK